MAAGSWGGSPEHSLQPVLEGTRLPQSKKRSSQRKAGAAKNARSRQRAGGSAAGSAKAGTAKPVPASKVPPASVPANTAPVQEAATGLRLARKLPTGRRAQVPSPVTAGGSASLTPARPAGEVAADASAGQAPGPPPGSGTDNPPAWAAKALEEVLMLTYWIDPGEDGAPFTATVRFAGRRIAATGRPQPGDTFSQEETVSSIVPGSGPVAVTAEIHGITPGEWNVTAQPVRRPGNGRFRPYPPPGTGVPGESRVPRPRRVKVPAHFPPTARTGRLVTTKVPGIVRPAYTTLVSLGALAGLGLEALLLHGGHYALYTP